MRDWCFIKFKIAINVLEVLFSKRFPDFHFQGKVSLAFQIKEKTIFANTLKTSKPTIFEFNICDIFCMIDFISSFVFWINYKIPFQFYNFDLGSCIRIFTNNGSRHFSSLLGGITPLISEKEKKFKLY